METSTKNSNTVNGKDDWESTPAQTIQGEAVYSGDKVINAYLKGVEDQKKEHKETQSTDEKIIIEKLVVNLNTAKQLCEKLSKLLLEKRIKFSTVFLKVKTITEFEAILIVPEKDFISDSFKSIYDLFVKNKQTTDNDTFDFSFNFMPHSKHINREKLSSDGYTLRYAHQ
ncbi:MAG: hypothetical protein ACUZ8E_14735 [Candidatus Anammoxibacter sp.]